MLPTSAREEKRMLADEMFYSILVQVGVVQLGYVVSSKHELKHI